MTRESAATIGRFSAFQKVMYHWGELYPYNAVHTCKIAGALRLEDLRNAIRQTYWRLGLGLVEVAPDGSSYRHETDHEPEVEVLSGGDNLEHSLTAHITRQLNRPFERRQGRPLRFSALEAGFGFHYVNVTYDHWVGDSVAIRLVLRRVLARYCGLEITENGTALERYPATYREVFAHRLGGLRTVAATLRWFCQWLRSHSAAQVAYSSVAQMGVNYELYRTAPGTVRRLSRFSRELGVTVHDLVLAALARAISAYLPRRSSRVKNRELVLGTIVDTRPDAREYLNESLGAFLAYYLVRCRPEESIGLGELAQRVAAVTRRIKTGRRYLDSVIGMKLMCSIWPYLSETDKPRFLRRFLPLTAGVSNVLLRDPWMMHHGQGPILACSRASPTGPIVPLVLTPTTWDQEMNIGLTYRVTGFPRAKIDGIMAMFMDQIEQA